MESHESPAASIEPPQNQYGADPFMQFDRNHATDPAACMAFTTTPMANALGSPRSPDTDSEHTGLSPASSRLVDFVPGDRREREASLALLNLARAMISPGPTLNARDVGHKARTYNFCVAEVKIARKRLYELLLDKKEGFEVLLSQEQETNVTADAYERRFKAEVDAAKLGVSNAERSVAIARQDWMAELGMAVPSHQTPREPQRHLARHWKLLQHSDRECYYGPQEDRDAKQDIPVYEREVMIKMRGQEVAAFPDTGAAGNFMTSAEARRRRFTINEKSRQVLRTPADGRLTTLGTVNVAVQFPGESKMYRQVFHVLAESIKPIILGSPFLSLTETMSKYSHRIVQRLRGFCSRRLYKLCYLGASQQRLSGWFDGKYVEALPDTGSDVTLVSAEWAKAQGLNVDSNVEEQIELEFVEGSTKWTSGVVRNIEWSFGKYDSDVTTADVWVLPGLPVDVLLGYEFLSETRAYVEHKEAFTAHAKPSTLENNGWWLNTITLVCNALGTSPTPGQEWQAQKTRLFARLDEERSNATAEGFSEAEIEARLQPLKAECQLAALDYGVFVYKTNQNADKVQSRKLGKEDSAAKAKIALAGDQ